MRAFLTGGTGFIGAKVAQRLRDRGDHVVAAVRDPQKAGGLKALDCEIVSVSLGDTEELARAMAGCDAVFHLAGRFELGVPETQRRSMMHANAGMTASVIDAAVAVSVRKIVYASTSNVFGDTSGTVVDERHKREGKTFLSLYDESKFAAHEVALTKVRAGAPVVIIQPGVVYGPGDHFEVGRQILLAAKGKLPLLLLGDIGFTAAYVDDVAGGFIAAYEKAAVGECYIFGGEITRLRDVLATSARIAGKPFRPIRVATPLLKLVAPLGSFIAPRLGYPPNLRELIRVADGVTYWVRDDKARRELGYAGRGLEEGLAETLKAAGVIV